ncbi:MAG: ThiF family adenylyltransferase [Deltaproteobacteria bacterium]|jgi:adenylyltransferase/sulfurtransferase|nr:ThiF family adenylyltransferase [Deltaproteobacteria bacterium]
MSDMKITIQSSEYGETPFDRAKLISWWSQDVVSSSSVLVVGAGAIGNETLKNLALLGVGKMFVCDMDTISVSNLSRTVLFGKDDVGKNKAEVAAKGALRMSNNPDCHIDYFVGDIVNGLGHGVFRRFDIVLGCLDNMLTRANVNRRCCLFQKPYLDAGISGLGLSLNAHRYPESSCLECGMDSNDVARERMIRYSCDAFKKRAIQEGHAATVLVSTAIVSALQVQEAIKALHQLNGIALEVPVRYGQKYYYQGMNNLFEQMTVPIKEDCDAHFTIDKVIETPLSSNDTLKEALTTLKGLFGYDCLIDTYPDSAFVTKAKCVSCHKEIAVNRPMGEIYSDELYCPDCQKSDANGYTPEYTAIDIFSSDIPHDYLMDYKLERLGVPPLHVLTVREKGNDDNIKYIELTGDLNRVLPNTFERGSYA